MICGKCSFALFCERRVHDPDKSFGDKYRGHVLSFHVQCEGNCDCLHPGFTEIAGGPTRPLLHGGIGGMRPGDILSPPVQSGYLRPQVCMSEVGLKQANKDWLLFKRTWRPDRVYCTVWLHLARRHAAGITNWINVTDGSQRFASHGAVYRVEPVGVLAPDLGMGNEHCCDMTHADADWCAWSAPKLMVTEVIEPSVEAKYEDAKLGRLDGAYDKWRYMNGGDHWWQMNQLEQRAAAARAEQFRASRKEPKEQLRLSL